MNYHWFHHETIALLRPGIAPYLWCIIRFWTWSRLEEEILTHSHTILLVQTGKNPNTRTYADYNTVDECTDGICKLFEEHLKKLHPHSPSITYDISELYDFIDSLTDLSCLIFQGEPHNTYLPFNKDWIKERIYIQLRKQAAGK